MPEIAVGTRVRVSNPGGGFEDLQDLEGTVSANDGRDPNLAALFGDHGDAIYVEIDGLPYRNPSGRRGHPLFSDEVEVIEQPQEAAA